MDDLLAEFVAETRETLAALGSEIVAWEANPADRARLDAIFRFVHTVKGSCGFLDLPRLARLSHAAEDVLAAVRDGARVADTPLVDAVLAIVDRIGAIVEAIDADAALDDQGEDALLAALADGAAAPAPAAVPRAPTRSVRLSVDLLDRMMGGMSDMVLARNELARRLRDGTADPASEAALERLSLTVADLRDIVTRTRMQRIDALFASLPRLVRDTAAAAGKAVTLAVDGADVELDREMIEVLRDPLLHMVRNAIDHGIEPPAERRLLGKRETGRLTVAARQSGNRIILEVSDDGRGIDVARLAAKASAADPKRAAVLREAGEQALLDLVFEPGLSSRDAATDLSGRGVGMDVVRANIEAIGGAVKLRNAPGRGVTVLAEVPLTLAILPTVGVTAAGVRCGVPRQAIDEILAVGSAALRPDRLGDALLATLRGRRLPVVDLGVALGLRALPDPALLLVIDVAGGSYALGIDAVHDTEELVVKPAAPAVMATGLYAGQTLPDDGGPLLLLDPAGLAAAAGLRFERTATPEPVAPAPEVFGEEVLLFDDLDGVRRAICLAVIDRIERVPAAAIATTGGQLRMAVDGALTTLVARAALPSSATIPVIRLGDGARNVGYAVAAVHDVVRLPPAPARSADPAVASVTLLDGVALELIDPLSLLGHADAQSPARLCLIRSADLRWLDRFARPALEAAGYRVVDALAPGETADVVLAMESDVATPAAGAPVVRLSARKGRGVYRYDRGALVAAVGEASA